LEEFGKTIKNTTIFTDRPLSGKTARLIKPALVVPLNEKITVVTDGLRFYLENITPELKQEIEAKQIEGMYKEAQKCYSKEYYKSVVRITNKILSRKANNKPVKILNLMARAQMFFTIKKYVSAVCPIDTSKDFNECGFSCAVLSDQGMDLAFFYSKVDI